MQEGQASEIVQSVEKVDEIDIYLFSNGQQYSPPRKYHLRTEDLNCWQATLNMLARLQYGALHSSIELFELDGRKLENPADIRDCAVYVAVVPPDAFIYAGYDKYLVKASRSFERRLIKKANGGQSGPDTTSPLQNVSIAQVKGSGIAPQCPNIRKTGEVRKSSLKNCCQKPVDRTKPVTHQVSQRQPRRYTNSSDIATKHNCNSKKDDPKITSRLSMSPGISGKSSTSGRGGSILRTKSPAKTLSFDTSTCKENQKVAKYKNDSVITNRKLQDSSNKLNVQLSYETSKLTNNQSTLKKGDTFTGARNLIVDQILNQQFDDLNIPHNEIEISKPTIKQGYSEIDKIPYSIVDNNVQPTKKEKISWPDTTMTPYMAEKIHGQSDRPIPIPKLEISIKEQIQAINNYELSNERTSTANKTVISNIIKELNHKLNSQMINSIPKATNTSQLVISDSKSTATDNKITVVDDFQSLINNETVEFIENQIVQRIPDGPLFTKPQIENSTISKQFVSISSEKPDTSLLVSEENFPKSPIGFSKLLTAEINEANTPTHEDLSDTNRIYLLNKTKNANKVDPVKTNLDLISLLNEARVCTEPQSFILKSEEAKGSKSKDRFVIVNETLDQTVKLSKNHDYIMQKSTTYSMNEKTKTNIDQHDFIDKIEVTTVDVTAKREYMDTPVVGEDNINNSGNAKNAKKIGLHADDIQINNEKSALVPENIYDLKIPRPYHVPENTLAHYVSLDESTLYTDVAINTEDISSSKAHSFTFYIKKDDNNTLKVKEVKSNLQKETVNIPLTNIVRDKDIVHINIFRSSVVEATEENTPKTQKCKDKFNNDMEDDCPSECDQCAGSIALKETDVTTTFINPTYNENNTNDALSSKLNIDGSASNTDQFIAIVQDGDILNFKLSFQIKDATGILKSAHKIVMCNPNSANQLPSDETNKTPNELTGSKSLQSIVNNSSPHICCRNKEKVVVHKCVCCENTNCTTAAKPLNPSIQGLYVLLPVVTPVQESVKTCSQTCDKQVQHTESLARVSMVSSVKETLLMVPGNSVITKTSETSSKRQVLIEDHDKNINTQVIMMRTEPSQTSSRFNTETKLQQTSRTNQDQSTQTDWCDVLLEARAEPDGHYTFFLPPLHVLQQYILR